MKADLFDIEEEWYPPSSLPDLTNCERIATIWNVLLRKKLLDKITPTEVTAMMIGLKLARLAEDMRTEMHKCKCKNCASACVFECLTLCRAKSYCL